MRYSESRIDQEVSILFRLTQTEYGLFLEELLRTKRKAAQSSIGARLHDKNVKSKVEYVIG